MANKLASWKETRDRILSQGVKIAELDQKVEIYRQRMGSVIGTDDLLYHMIAQKEYSLSMPKFTTLEQKGGVSVPLGLDEIGYTTPASKVSIVAYVADIGIVDGKKGDNIRATLLDGGAKRQLSCYFPELVADVLQTIQIGKVYKFDNLGVFKREGRNGYPPDAQLTWGERSKAAETDTNVFVNMREKALKDGQPCLYNGFVTDEESRTYQGCSKCRKGTKKVPLCPGAEEREISMYSATITDGTGAYTLSFGSRPPKDSILYSAVQVIGTFSQARNEIRVIRYTQVEKNALPKHQDVVSGAAGQAVPVQQNGVTVRKATPDEVLLAVVQKYTVSPRQAVVYKLTKEVGMTPEDAEKFIASRVADGTMTQNGETLKWNR